MLTIIVIDTLPILYSANCLAKAYYQVTGNRHYYQFCRKINKEKELVKCRELLELMAGSDSSAAFNKCFLSPGMCQILREVPETHVVPALLAPTV